MTRGHLALAVAQAKTDELHRVAEARRSASPSVPRDSNTRWEPGDPPVRHQRRRRGDRARGRP